MKQLFTAQTARWKAAPENYDTIKFINSKTLSTFPGNKFDDDNFYQRDETILVLCTWWAKEKRKRKLYGKSWNSNKKKSKTLPPKESILSIFQLFQCGDECVFIMFRRRTLDEIASDEYKELRFPAIVTAAIVITFCALPFNAMTFSVHIKLLCSV